MTPSTDVSEITRNHICFGAEAEALGRGGAAGAVVTFTGHVRGGTGDVEAMTLEHIDTATVIHGAR